MSFYKMSYKIAQKSDNLGPVTDADVESHHCICDILKKEFPQDAFLSEEGYDDLIRLQKKRVWCIDPLDGTKNFIKKIDEFSIHIGLIIDKFPAFGMVFLPVQQILIWGSVEGGTFSEKNGEIEEIKCSKKKNKKMILMHSRDHFSSEDFSCVQKLSPDQLIKFGSVGGKAVQMLQGKCSLFFYSHPLSEWDTCAPEAIIRGSGGTVVDFLDQPLLYNQKIPVNRNGIIFFTGQLDRKIFKNMKSS